jgi:hypothetical protein
MPVVRSGVLDSFGQIRYRPGFLLLFPLLLRLELGTLGKATFSSNKAAVARGHGLMLLCRSASKPPLASLGGKEREWKGTSISASWGHGDDLDVADGEWSLPLAGLSGEGRKDFRASSYASCASGGRRIWMLAQVIPFFLVGMVLTWRWRLPWRLSDGSCCSCVKLQPGSNHMVADDCRDDLWR